MDRIWESHIKNVIELKFVQNILYGGIRQNSDPSEHSENIQNVDLPTSVWERVSELDGELRAFSLVHPKTTIGDSVAIPRPIRLGLCQMSLPYATTEAIRIQKSGLLEAGLKYLSLANLAGVNVFCFQELWTMPMGFCTGKKLPWVEFAEDPISGETTTILRQLAREYRMVIISPILERDEDDLLWNTAVVIDADGTIVGTYRKVHIPIAGNESAYFQPSNFGVPVFNTKYGRIGISMCYDRHFPAHWYALALGEAEIIVNPSASVASFSQSLWPIEARFGAVTTGAFVASINRVGKEVYSGMERVFGGDSYVTSPTGRRTPSLGIHKSGLLVVDIDLGECIRKCSVTELQNLSKGDVNPVGNSKDILSAIGQTFFQKFATA